MKTSRVLLATAVLLGSGGAGLLFSPPASAETANFELYGKIYTKWLYRNNDKQGVLTLGNPFWPDNISGDNGVATEFELNILGRVSDSVRAGVRIKSRFGALWQDWWENGDIAYDEENTSGESLGMNRAQYIKLRGYWIQAQLPIPTVDSVLVGSSDLGMFNEWTIGKVRYIDRDNGKGIFIQGTVDEDYLRYTAAVIALPKLWVGPNWSTGVGDPLLRIPFYSQDWGYGLKLESDPLEDVRLTAIVTATVDSEIDRADPDAVGSENATCLDELGNPIPGCARDGAVDWSDRYTNVVGTLEAQIDSWDGGSFNLLGGFSVSRINEDYAGNGVLLNNGVFPLVYDDITGGFVRARAELFDIAENVSLRLEYFNIGQHFQTIFGARREADVLLTDGFLEGGQIPTLNSANEFVDFDEPWYETIIGWHGGTAILAYESDLELSLEETFLTYNTNAQERDVETKYPDFLHTDGYTDTDLYDYANVYDRGRDPRSVFHRNQDRMSNIAVLKGLWRTGLGRGFELGFKLKFIWDQDKRSDTTSEDDYLGLISTNRLWVAYPFADGLKVTLGGQFDYWKEDNRRGTLEQGYGDDTTTKVRPWLDLSYTFKGFALRYRLEYVYKDAQRERDTDREFNVIRSKASLEVGW
ncbi:MAG: hypothetical protein KC635_13020 [Myxococcales bacterium]|nr:hypothetical protein [Myxococcales bacterium]MCB9733440.1 hypothetical protein [Deltaproteobacteria bacterium]